MSTFTAEYTAWLNDPRNDGYRLVLIEIEHSGGTIRLASEPWLSPEGVAYDDWLLDSESLYIEQSLSRRAVIGDIRAINPTEGHRAWAEAVYRGRPCRWLHGDRRWSRAQFQAIATPLVEYCRPQGSQQYQFDLRGGGWAFEALSLVDTETARSGTVLSNIEWLNTEYGIDLSLVNISDAVLARSVSFTLTESARAWDMITALATACNAYATTDNNGAAQIIRPSSSGVVLIDEQIVALSVVSVEPAYARIVATLDDGTEITRATDADTGQLEEAASVRLILSSSEAAGWLDAAVSEYANTHHQWELQLAGDAFDIAVGDRIGIIHPDLTAAVTVHEIRYRPLSSITIIEVRT